MKTKVITLLLLCVFFVSCGKRNGDAYKYLQDNMSRFNTTESYLDDLYNEMDNAKENPNGLKTSAKNLIDYVDTYLNNNSKNIPSSLDGINDIDNAMLFYMSVAKQMALLSSDYADKAATLTDEELDGYDEKLGLLEDSLFDSYDRLSDLQEQYAKKHNIKLENLSDN